MKITKRQLRRIIEEATRSKPWAWEAELESFHQDPGALREKQHQVIDKIEEAIELLGSMHDYHHMPQVEKVLESMRKVYQV